MPVTFRAPRPRSLARGALTAAAACALVVGVGTAPTAAAAPVEADTASSPSVVDTAVDGMLTATGEPGPHRVPGHYFTSPGVPQAAEAARPSVLVGPSTPLIVGAAVCTATAAGVDDAGNTVAVTAGHCGSAGDEVRSADDPDGVVIGTYQRSGGVDNGVILLNGHAQVTRSYNDAALSGLGGGMPVSGSVVCKTGISTGTTCGPTVMASGAGFTMHVCSSHGDSGAPVYQGGRLVGLLSGGFAGLPSCQTPAQGPLHSPVQVSSWDAVAAEMDAAGGVGAGFRLP